eukprot:3938862-Rhodomonas_salina.3
MIVNPCRSLCHRRSAVEMVGREGGRSVGERKCRERRERESAESVAREEGGEGNQEASPGGKKCGGRIEASIAKG